MMVQGDDVSAGETYDFEQLPHSIDYARLQNLRSEVLGDQNKRRFCPDEMLQNRQDALGRFYFIIADQNGWILPLNNISLFADQEVGG